MKLTEYLKHIEERANDPNDIAEPLCYVYNSNKSNTITIDITQWENIKNLANEEASS